MSSRAGPNEFLGTDVRADELRLVHRLAGGEASAWERFVTDYAGVIRGAVRHVLATFGRPHDDASSDDLTAEVFSALLGNGCRPLTGFQGRSSLATYLRVIAVRVAIRHVTRRQAENGASSGATVGEVTSDPVDHRDSGPTQRLISAEERSRLHDVVDRLPDRQRAMVRMHHFEGLTYRQISDRMQVPIGSIGPTLQRAERRLREMLDDQAATRPTDVGEGKGVSK